MLLKPVYRKIVKKKIEQMSYDDKSFFSNIIAGKLYRTKEFQEAKTVFLYNSTANEVFTKAIIVTSIIMHKSVYMPVVKGDDLHPVLVDSSTKYTLNCWDINEPIYKDKFNDGVKFDLVIVPLVAFDKNRNRLGRGKGYYDRYLTDKDSFNIALAYSCQELEEIPVNKNDVKMSMILTEKDTY